MAETFISCSVPGCNKNAHKRANGRRGMCCAHYERWRRHGNPLGGTTPTGEPWNYYQRVVLPYAGDECLIWPYNRAGGRYAYLWHGRKGFVVSRLACEEVHGPAPSSSHEAAHSCGNGHKGCVNPRHLSWKLPVENCADQIAHGTRLRGERQNGARLNRDDVKAIRESTKSHAALAAEYGVTASTIRRARDGSCWGWLK